MDEDISNNEIKKNRKKILRHTCYYVAPCCVLLIIVTISYVIKYAVLRKSSEADETNPTELIFSAEIAAEISRSLNSTIAPCHNFYEFACGKSRATESDFNINQTIILENLIRKQLRQAMSENIAPSDPKYIRNVKTTYQFCLHLGKTTDECVKFVREKLTIATNFLYANKVYDKNSEQTDILIHLTRLVADATRLFTHVITDAITRGVTTEISKTDNETLQHVDSVRKKIRGVVGYKGTYFDETFIDNDRTIIVENTMESIDAYAAQLIPRNIAMRGDVQRPVWAFVVKSVTNVTISSFPYTNDHIYLNVPMAMMQGIFYDTSRPQLMNYGSLGSQIARTLMTIFKDESVITDIINSVELCLNGPPNSLIDFSNLYGFKMAYLAYKYWLMEHYGAEPRPPPKLPYTNSQLFWIYAARPSCIAVNEDRFALGERTKKEAMINKLFSNIEDFSNDFQCPVGSYMNPPNKCSIQ